MGTIFPPFSKKELGGGTILDIGIYCTQFISHVFDGEKPLKVIAGGHVNSDGVDESTSVTLIYSGGRTATVVTHSQIEMPNEALAIGTKGTLKVRYRIQIFFTCGL
jgi:dihydrodiol dehydrogenase / D-xylose 1-dehydrogenase (NADP)